MIRGLRSDLPASGIARISNFGSHAGTHSAPNVASVGPAALTLNFPPQGHPIHPGLAGGAMPGSASVLETPVAASLDAAPSLAGAPGGRAFPGLRRDRLFLHLDRCSGKHAGQYIAESLGSVAPSIIGFAHVSNMRESNVQVVASAYVTERK